MANLLHTAGRGVVALLLFFALPANAQWFFGGGTFATGSGNVTAAFTARIAQGNSGATCVIPCAVHLDAIGDGTDETLDPDYTTSMADGFAWDLDNVGAGNWATTGASKEVDYGFVTGVLYESAGDHDPILTVQSPDGDSDTATTTITVVSQATQFSAANTYCASTTGDYSGCVLPCTNGDGDSGDNCVTTSDFDQWLTLGADCGATLSSDSSTDDCPNADADNVAMYLHGGETFTNSVGSSLTTLDDATAPRLLTSYGSGKAIVTVAPTVGSGTIVSDIIFNSSIPGADTITNVTFNRVEVVDDVCLHNSWASHGDAGSGGSTQMTDTIAFVDLTCHGVTGQFTTYWGGRRWWFAGLDFDRLAAAPDNHYSMRTKSIQWTAFQHNKFVGNDPGGNHIQIRAEDEFGSGYPGTGAGTADDWAVKFNWWSDLILEHDHDMPGFAIRVCNDSGCNCVQGLSGSGYPNGCIGSGSGFVVPVRDFVFDRIYVRGDGTGTAGGKQHIFQIVGGNIKIENPIIDYRDAYGENANDIGLVWMAGQTPSLGGDDGPDVGKIWILNPTFVANGTGAASTYTMAFQWVRSDTSAGNGGCVDCELYAAALYWVSGWSGTVDTTETNLTVHSIPAVVTSDPFVAITAQPSDADAFTIDSGSAWYQAGYDYTSSDPVFLYRDAFGNAAPASNYSAGASQP